MAKRDPEPSGGIPAWLMTYNDVITLMMTFFILLLTFSTTEKEDFERLRVAMFSDGASSGYAGKADAKLDTLVFRTRPRSGRIARRGSEMPPITRDPTLSTLKKGLASLSTDPRDPSESCSIVMRMPMLISINGEITAFGQQVLKMFATQLKKFPLELTMTVGREVDAGRCVLLGLKFAEQHQIVPGRIAVSVTPGVQPGTIRFVTRRPVIRK